MPRQDGGFLGWLATAGEGVPDLQVRGLSPLPPGRVLAELREVSHAGSEGIAFRELGRRVKPDFDERDPQWLYATVGSLCKDGLAKVACRPEAPGMVAEERAPYGVSPEERSLEQKANLP
jgi:hypothetical protein